MPVMQRELGDGTRLLDVRFSYLDLSDAQADSELVDADSGDGEGATEFGLAVAARGSGLLLTADPAVLGRAAVDRLAAMYRAVLESMAADVDGDARETFLPAGERERVLTTWNDSRVPARALSVPELITEQVARHPNAVAVESSGTAVSYAELDARANRLAHRLREAGVAPESSVAVLLDRSVDLVVALLAVWRAGAGFVPMDPVLPAGRIADMVTDARVQVALTSTAYADRFEVPVVRVEDDFSHLPQSPPEVPVDLDTVAYTVFTSGSTGRPKGVQVSHRNLANHIDWAVRDLTTAGTGGAPVFSSVAFDLVIPNVWAPWPPDNAPGCTTANSPNWAPH